MAKKHAPLSRQEEEEQKAVEAHQQRRSTGKFETVYSRMLNKLSPLKMPGQKNNTKTEINLSDIDLNTEDGQKQFDFTLTFEEQALLAAPHIYDETGDEIIADIPEIVEAVSAEQTNAADQEQIIPAILHLEGITATERNGTWVIETPGYTRNWFSKAWREVGNYIAINSNATWIWRRPDGRGGFQENSYGYKLSSPEAGFNFQNISAAEAMEWLPRFEKITGNVYYSAIVRKRPTDPSLTQAFADLVLLTQQTIKMPAALCNGKLTLDAKARIIRYEAEQLTKEGETQAAEMQLNENVSLPDIPVPKQELSIGEQLTRAAIGQYMELMYGPLVDPIIDHYTSYPKNIRGKLMVVHYQKLQQQFSTPGQAPEWSKWLSPLDTLWPVFRGITSGYYGALATMSPEQTDAMAMNLLTAFKDPDFLIGSFYGIFPGIGKWFVDLLEMIKSLTELPGQIIDFFGTTVPNAFSSATSWLAEHRKELMTVFTTLLTDPELMQSMMASAATAIKSALHGAGVSAGELLGKAAITFGSLSHYDMGAKLGGIVGYIIPEILLAVFTEGIGFVLKQGANAARTIMTALKIGKTVGKGFELLKTFFGTLMKLLRGVMGKLKATGQAGMEKLLEFLDGIKNYLGLSDEVTDIARIDNLADSRPDFAKHVDEATELEAKRKADLEYKDKTDSLADEKAKVYAEAIVLTKAADVIDMPIEELLATLKIMAQKAGLNATFKANDLGFDAEGGHRFEIVMNPIVGVVVIGGGKNQLSGKALKEMEAKIDEVKNANRYDSAYRERFEKLKTLVSEFRNRTFKIGDYYIQLDQEAIAHIFGRHHPEYFISIETSPQSFFDKKFKIENLVQLFERIEKASKGDPRIIQELLRNKRGGFGTSFFKKDGVYYQIGMNGHSPFQVFVPEAGSISYQNAVKFAIEI